MSWSEKVVEKWWACVLMGVGAIFFTIVERHHLQALEAGKEKLVVVSSLTRTIYDISGVTGTTVLGFLIGLFLIGYGVYLYLRNPQ